MDVRLLGVVPLLVFATVIMAVGQRGVIVDVRVPGGPVREVITETPAVMVADVPMIVAMLGRRVGVLRFLPLAFGPLPDVCHHGASFRFTGYLETCIACARRPLCAGNAVSASRFAATGHGPDLDEAAQEALRGILAYLEEHHGLARPQAFILASACVDLRISQVVNGEVYTVSAFLPLAIFRTD